MTIFNEFNSVSLSLWSLHRFVLTNKVAKTTRFLHYLAFVIEIHRHNTHTFDFTMEIAIFIFLLTKQNILMIYAHIITTLKWFTGDRRQDVTA